MMKGQLYFPIALMLGAMFVAEGAGSLCRTPRATTIGWRGNVAFAQPAPRPTVARAEQMESSGPDMEIPERLRAKQQKDLRKYRFDKLKENAAELAKLANSLHEDLDKSNENILSLQIVDKAAKIEKLAKKIQDQAKSGM